MKSFSELGLSANILGAVKGEGYRTPTPIQAKAIPLILEKRDVIGSAQTGTGKTAAFALPILTQLEVHRREPRTLVLEPTRELAEQVKSAFRAYARHTNLKTTAIYGGVGVVKQKAALKNGVDILVATPGRLMDFINQKAISLRSVRHLVLDEADRMLDMGFLPTVRKIISRCPDNRQSLLFSATIPPQIEELSRWFLRSPHQIDIGGRRSPAATVRHSLYPVAEKQKISLLRALLDHLQFKSVICFCRTRKRANKIAEILERNEHRVGVLHSDRSQQEREQTLDGFRKGIYDVLVATDIASRGLDISEVSHVINVDPPLNPEVYVHRIGRTGRARALGDAFTIMTKEDRRQVEAIERFIGRRIPQKRLPHFKYREMGIPEPGRKTETRSRPRVKRVSLSGRPLRSRSGRRG